MEPDEDENPFEIDGATNELVANELTVETLMGWDGEPKGLCGCWNAMNTHPSLDLRQDAMHGTPGHANHARTVHTWCAICSPGSVPVFEGILG